MENKNKQDCELRKERYRIYQEVMQIFPFAELDEKRWEELLNIIIKIIYEIKMKNNHSSQVAVPTAKEVNHLKSEHNRYGDKTAEKPEEEAIKSGNSFDEDVYAKDKTPSPLGTFNKKIEDLKKGCGIRISGEYNGGGYWEMECGYLGRLCPTCEAKLQTMQEDKEYFLKKIEELDIDILDLSGGFDGNAVEDENRSDTEPCVIIRVEDWKKLKKEIGG